MILPVSLSENVSIEMWDFADSYLSFKAPVGMARRTKEEAEETRIQILDAAERVFYDKGVSRASLAEIASDAGVSRGAIYWHFEN